MKPPRFEYHNPESIDDALWLLSEYGSEAKVLAGGQSLMPLLNFRLAQPAHVVDVNRIEELSYIKLEDDVLAIGAIARQADVEDNEEVARRVPLIHEALRWVGHPQIRNRGTVCGSLAHADPAAELPSACIALGGTAVVEGVGGRREVPLAGFFVDYLTPDLAPEELLIEVRIPVPPANSGGAFVEFARRHGDYAIVGVAAQVRLDADGMVAGAEIVLSGVDATPVIAERAAERLKGERPSDRLLAEVAGLAEAATDPETTFHGSAEYRRHLSRVFTERALRTAIGRAGGAAA